MDGKLAVNKIKASARPEERRQMVSLLEQEVKTGNIDGSVMAEELNILYRLETDPGILSEIKRLQNRTRLKAILGKDLLKLSSPPLGDAEKKELWKSVQGLRSAYNESFKQAETYFESKYTVLEKIGDGGMSVVFRGKRVSDDKDVAIKFLREKFFSSPMISERFARECKLSLSFKHPHIVEVLEVDKGSKSGYLIMEYLPLGGADTLVKDPDLTIEEALQIMAKAGQALAYIHEKKIVHRDVKLSNLLIASRTPGEKICVKLSDFGISKDFSQTGLTVVGTRMGTNFYSAPEQRESCETVDFRADIYSLGVCLYRLLSGKGYPEGNFPPISALREDTPVAVDQIIMDCLEVNPENRLGSAREFTDRILKIKPNT